MHVIDGSRVDVGLFYLWHRAQIEGRAVNSGLKLALTCFCMPEHYQCMACDAGVVKVAVCEVYGWAANVSSEGCSFCMVNVNASIAAPVRSAKQIAGLRKACRIAREILDKGHAAIRPGITTDDIDRVVSSLPHYLSHLHP